MDSKNERFQDQPTQPREAVYQTPEELRASQDTADRLRQASAWLGNSATSPRGTIKAAEPIVLTAEQMRQADATRDQLGRPSPWHNRTS